MVNQEPKDIETATMNALIDAVINQNSDYSKVETPMTGNIHKDHSDEYLSTISESAQLEIDTIMQGLAVIRVYQAVQQVLQAVQQVHDHSHVANLGSYKNSKLCSCKWPCEAPVDDISLEVVKPVDETVNLHPLFDSQILSYYPDSVVAAHLAALEDESTDFKQTFAFEGYGISDDIPSYIVKEYKKWVLEGLLKFHSKKKINDDHYKAKASSLGVQQYDFVVAHARSKIGFT
ncbi:hypothetical protein FXO38_31838 [Capsicum annuum]|uniref:Uncharacterized protein n=1 Tax=Capsicum annuum TaxID=4072 RepID=A0A2G3A4R2_CAPAN|nr:hypothetical protein FXO38_31838 [Capsicum annuum]KAF3622306.1 hypothetical protein FXO37_32399 [Capsicum annuum]PHT89227.1 hypothetical protein T459_04340 [Capsicum annuum]